MINYYLLLTPIHVQPLGFDKSHNDEVVCEDRLDNVVLRLGTDLGIAEIVEHPPQSFCVHEKKKKRNKKTMTFRIFLPIDRSISIAKRVLKQISKEK